MPAGVARSAPPPPLERRMSRVRPGGGPGGGGEGAPPSPAAPAVASQNDKQTPHALPSLAQDVTFHDRRRENLASPNYTDGKR